MSTFEKAIPKETIEAVARSFFKETRQYGFKQVDYIKFVNQLLDISMNSPNEKESAESEYPEISVWKTEGKMHLPILGERLIIRQFNPESDLELFKKWIEDENGRYFLLSRTTAQRLNIEQLLNDDRNLVGVITLLDSKPIGLLAFLEYDAEQRKAELRKLIGESEYREKGMAKQATRYWIQYGLTSLGLQKIYLNTLDTNLRNVQLNEELGFKVEGILRDECYFDNEYHDILRMGMLVKDLKGLLLTDRLNYFIATN